MYNLLHHFCLNIWCLCLLCLNDFWIYAGNRFLFTQERFRSSYVGNLGRRVRDADEASDAARLKELYHRNDPESVIRLFESQPSLHTNQSALSEYIKALVKVDRLDESELLRTLRRGSFLGQNVCSPWCFICVFLCFFLVTCSTCQLTC